MNARTPSRAHRAFRLVAAAGSALLDLVFPPRCLLCRSPLERSGGQDLCPQCRRSLPLSSPPQCAGCGRVPAGGALDFCPRCRGHYARDGLLVLGPFDGPLRELVHLFKYRADLQAGAFLGKILAGKVAGELRGRCDLVVPVPLHRRRLRSRGFNQASLLGRKIAAATGWPLRPAALKRHFDTGPFTGLSGRERRQAIAGAVRMRRPIAEGTRVLLVDDVLTSGATSEECCRVLKEGGAALTVVAAVARRP